MNNSRWQTTEFLSSLTVPRGLMVSVRGTIDVGVLGVPAIAAFSASESGYAMRLRLRLDFALRARHAGQTNPVRMMLN